MGDSQRIRDELLFVLYSMPVDMERTVVSYDLPTDRVMLESRE